MVTGFIGLKRLIFFGILLALVSTSICGPHEWLRSFVSSES